MPYLDEQLKAFYDRQYRGDKYGTALKPEEHDFYGVLDKFIRKHNLGTQPCLEIGCGRGAFQDVVSDYVGTDISFSVHNFLHQPFCQCSAVELPFADNSFAAIWTYAVLEHVPEPERALEEMRRILKNDGLLLLAPAWQCPSWAAQGYPVRPYGDFNWMGKLIKASLLVRRTIWFRSLFVLPRRLVRLMTYLIWRRPSNFQFRKLVPNYDHFWMSDSDAVNSMDQLEAILWFVSRGDECISHPNAVAQFTARKPPVELRIHK